MHIYHFVQVGFAISSFDLLSNVMQFTGKTQWLNVLNNKLLWNVWFLYSLFRSLARCDLLCSVVFIRRNSHSINMRFINYFIKCAD